MNYSLLYVEDDVALTSATKKYFSERGYEVLLSDNAEEALFIYQKNHPDIILLDITIHGKLSGYYVLNTIRRENTEIPIIILSSNTDKDEVIKGLKAGADDYIRKNCHLDELHVRVEKCLMFRSAQTKVFSVTPLTSIYTATHSLHVSGEIFKLALREYRLIFYLYCHKNEIIRRDIVCEKVGIGYRADSFDSMLSQALATLRSDLRKDPNIAIITIRREGLLMKVEENE